MAINLFPALLIAGPPHSGKSVLSFLLSQSLKETGIVHYLLNAAPDGEGNWFHETKGGWVRSLRQEAKGDFSDEFLEKTLKIINSRLLPLLVDVGGLPQGKQFNILNACTHSIILYKKEKDLELWRTYLQSYNLIPLAELHSLKEGDGKIFSTRPVLRASISHLTRQKAKRGQSFGALLEKITGVFYYRNLELEKIHLASAPAAPLLERELAEKIGIRGEKLYWQREDLPLLRPHLSKNSALALYGKGPVWLAGFIGAQSTPKPFFIFDIRYGWINLNKILPKKDASLQYKKRKYDDVDWMDLKLPKEEVLPQEISLPFWHGAGGLVLSGVLPRWLYAALSAEYAPKRDWLGIYEPRINKAIVIFSRVPSVKVGELFSLSKKKQAP